MRPLMVNNLSEALASMGVDLVGDIPGDAKTTNRLLLANLIQQKIALAFSGIGIDWDYYNVKVDIGARATKICDVMQGDVVVLEIVNVDWPQASPVFLGMNSSVQPGMTTGMEASYARLEQLVCPVT